MPVSLSEVGKGAADLRTLRAVARGARNAAPDAMPAHPKEHDAFLRELPYLMTARLGAVERCAAQRPPRSC